MTAMVLARLNSADFAFLAVFAVLIYRWQRGSSRRRMDAAIQRWVKASGRRALVVGIGFTLVGVVMVIFADAMETRSRSAGSIRFWGAISIAVGGWLSVLLLVR